MNALRAALGTDTGETDPTPRRADGAGLEISIVVGLQSVESMVNQIAAYSQAQAGMDDSPGLQALYGDGDTDGMQFIGKALKSIWDAIFRVLKWVGQQMRRFWKWVFGSGGADGNDKKGSRYEKSGPKKLPKPVAELLVITDKWRVLAEEAAGGNDESLDELFKGTHGFSKLSLPDTEHAAAKEKLKNNLEYFKAGAEFTVGVPPDHAELLAHHEYLLKNGEDVASGSGLAYKNVIIGAAHTQVILKNYWDMTDKINSIKNTKASLKEYVDGVVEEVRKSVVPHMVDNAPLPADDAKITTYRYTNGGATVILHTDKGGVGVRIGWEEPHGEGVFTTMPTTVGPIQTDGIYSDLEKATHHAFVTTMDMAKYAKENVDKILTTLKSWDVNKEAGAMMAKHISAGLKEDAKIFMAIVPTTTHQIKALAILLAIGALTN